ncbi:unnamed protein product [Moneuplotes crassus]|uniref:Uncharacterized protein n=1 Tax=Euplotes crassus TaxID=5936 RepID=A0AAD1XUV2_EUPCR|nr:unnamed protein product [Moneuplotes crassus]
MWNFEDEYDMWEEACFEGEEDQLGYYMVRIPLSTTSEALEDQYLKVNIEDPDPFSQIWANGWNTDCAGPEFAQKINEIVKEYREKRERDVEEVYNEVFKGEIEILEMMEEMHERELSRFEEEEVPRAMRQKVLDNFERFVTVGEEDIGKIKCLIESCLSLVRFEEPTIAPSGHTFDKTETDYISSIKKDPITREDLCKNSIREHYIAIYIADFIEKNVDSIFIDAII